jgi:tetratricopeptide (TPR) repeat protein
MTGGDSGSGVLPRALVALGGSVWKKLKPIQAERRAAREPPGRIGPLVEQQIQTTFSHLTGIAEDDAWWTKLCTWAGSAYVQTDFFRSDARKEWLADRITREGIVQLVSAELIDQAGDPQALSRVAHRYAHHTGEHPKLGEDATQLVVGVVLAALFAPLDASDRSLLAAIQSGTEHLAGLIEALHTKLDRLAPGADREERAPRVPMQVANPVTYFQGREDALAKVIEGLCREGGSAISAIHGMGGIGKTELARLVAKKLRDLTTDGQIQVDLLGTSDDPQQDVRAMAEVVRAFDRTASEPQSDAEAISAYHHALQGKRVLLLLDNASNGSQVKRLIDHKSDNCLVLVTSRQTISLPGLAALPLPVLSKEEARALLRSEVAAERATDEQLDQISERCGYLPLALRAAGRFLAEYGDWPIAGYLADLSDEQRRLARLNVEDDANLNVAAVLSLSARQLRRDKPDTAAHWQQLAVFRGDFDQKAAASVWDVAAEDVRGTLADLRRRSMVLWEQQHDRYRLHDLMHDVARLPLEGEDEATVDVRLEEAAARHAQHYCGVLAAAQVLYLKGGENVPAGLALYDLEQRNIAAGQAWAVERLPMSDDAARLTAAYADTGAHVLDLRFSPRARIVWLEAQLEACRRLGDRRSEGAALGNLGTAYLSLGEARRAIEHYDQWHAIAREIGHRRGEGQALGNLGNAYAALGETRRAIEYHEQRFAIAREMADRRGEAHALGNLGIAYAALGETQRAIGYFAQDLTIAREIGDRRGEAHALGNLGNAYAYLGQPRRAIEHYEQHLAIAREIGDRRGEGLARGGLGNAYFRLGEQGRAIEHYEEWLAIAREIGDRRSEGLALGNLGNFYLSLREPRRAIEHYNQSLALTSEMGDRQGEGNSLFNSALALDALSERHEAIRRMTVALRIYEQIEDPNAARARAQLAEWRGKSSGG